VGGQGDGLSQASEDAASWLDPKRDAALNAWHQPSCPPRRLGSPFRRQLRDGVVAPSGLTSCPPTVPTSPVPPAATQHPARLGGSSESRRCPGPSPEQSQLWKRQSGLKSGCPEHIYKLIAIINYLHKASRLTSSLKNKSNGKQRILPIKSPASYPPGMGGQECFSALNST